MNQRTRVLVVEDEPATRDAICAAVTANDELCLVGAAASVDSALSLFMEQTFDVLLLDLQLGEENGLQLVAARAASSRNRHARILVISVLGDESSVIDALEAGADGYLLKDGAIDQIGAAIRDVLSGNAPISPAIARHVLRRLRRQPSTATPDSDCVLSRRELQMLEALAQGFSYKEVAEKHAISYHTVADYVKSLYQKLHVGSRGAAVAKGVQSGLVSMERKEQCQERPPEGGRRGQ